MSVGRVCSDIAIDCGERALVGFGAGGSDSDAKGLGIQLCIEGDFAEEGEEEEVGGGGGDGGEERLGGGLFAS